MKSLNRRNFIKASGFTLLPVALPAAPLFANNPNRRPGPANEPIVKFFGDGEFYDGLPYLEQLQAANSKQPLKVDRYGSGGAVEELEKKFQAATGKEKAIYMPSGTMANQFAIAMLSGDNTKVFVQDTSHVYRDEADAAQSIFNKRLIPLAKNQTFFTADELKKAIENLDSEEVFKSGLGCVSIETPVRRTDGKMIPMEEIKKISEYCRSKNIKLHLDGARLYMASAWSGISIKEYASYFDTVYISLYKYLGASAGAILCGERSLIEKMPHMMKIHGGNMFGNWLNAAMASYKLDGIEERLQEAIKRSKEIFSALNQIPGTKISPLEKGTNIYTMKFPSGLNVQKLGESFNNYFIRIPRPNENGEAKISVNETLLYREPKYIIDAIKDSFNKAK
ncbi:MAG TPA: aminotransferase class I/II-fold pyridoxal phosphate-dependent enzyme [Chitinophagaceae bacterium]|nr:aminotransferase class I/II-fold pyridoxal phosphate-dependent enzyme [Chitinophagaceae bacterium]